MRRIAALAIAAWTLFACTPIRALELATNEVGIVFTEGTVEFSQAGAVDWQITTTNNILRPGYRLRTRERSRAMLLWGDRATATISESTIIEILPAADPKAQAGLHLWRGLLSFFHRDEPGRLRVITRSAMAGIKGTEFVIAVDPVTDATTLSVIDGEVTFSNPQGALTLTNREQAVAEPGQGPRRTPGFTANNVLQWCFYYPGVLHVDELPLSAPEREALGDSIEAYRAGDLLAALRKYPATRPPASAERVYYAGLLLAVGLAEQADASLKQVEATGTDARTTQLASGLRLLIAAVKRESRPNAPAEAAAVSTATEALALSYYEQSRAVREESLRRALTAAQRATELAPDFGFAWARLAELEFSFGRTAAALRAVERSQALSPRNAQAVALRGFLAAAQNRTRSALDYFNHALALDPALGHAWLGRGLCQIRLSTQILGFGDTSAGRQDLLVAASVEPQRSLLRSYLGKAWSLDHRHAALARKELDLAIQLDPADPTPWLYRALLNEQENRLNEGIHDLERSVALNDNRRVYRSQERLDEDRSLRSVDLARLYDDNGMTTVALEEASRAVGADYANHSAHFFLANSYARLRPEQALNLRYETATFSEYLLANLLAPSGTGLVTPAISQQEYARLLERHRVGLSGMSQWSSEGAWLAGGSQYGDFGRSSYAIEGQKRKAPDRGRNQDLDDDQVSILVKQSITPRNVLFFQAIRRERSGGDLRQLVDPDNFDPVFRFRERQEPVLLAGLRHEWSPSHNTLLLYATAHDRLNYTNRQFAGPYFVGKEDKIITALDQVGFEQNYRNKFDVSTVELQHIAQFPRHSIVAGARVQWSSVDVRNVITNITGFDGAFSASNVPPSVWRQDSRVRPSREAIYAYHYWQPADPIQLVVGITHDHLRLPVNIDSTPLAPDMEDHYRWSPKAGFIYSFNAQTHLRAAYTRSIGGLGLDQSYRLEPSQLAGFVQSFRSIAPESIAGAVAGARFETFGAALERKWADSTYLSLGGEVLRSESTRHLGAYTADSEGDGAARNTRLDQRADYLEKSLSLSLHQLLGAEWVVSLNYRVSHAALDRDILGLPADTFLARGPSFERSRGLLQHLNLQATYHHSSGFFGGGEINWYDQDLQQQPFDSFWQLNLRVGCTFARRRVEVSLALLNLTGQDYRLSPINFHASPARERTLAANLRFNF